MMLQFISINIKKLTFELQILYLQGFRYVKIYLRKPCSFDCVTQVSKLIRK